MKKQAVSTVLRRRELSASSVTSKEARLYSVRTFCTRLRYRPRQRTWNHHGIQKEQYMTSLGTCKRSNHACACVLRSTCLLPSGLLPSSHLLGSLWSLALTTFSLVSHHQHLLSGHLFSPPAPSLCSLTTSSSLLFHHQQKLFVETFIYLFIYMCFLFLLLFRIIKIKCFFFTFIFVWSLEKEDTPHSFSSRVFFHYYKFYFFLFFTLYLVSSFL
jgi:hypothetical protein